MEDEADHHEGCHVYGSMEVKRVAGRLHMSVHQNMVFQMLPQLLGGHHIPKVRSSGCRGLFRQALLSASPSVGPCRRSHVRSACKRCAKGAEGV